MNRVGTPSPPPPAGYALAAPLSFLNESSENGRDRDRWIGSWGMVAPPPAKPIDPWSLPGTPAGRP